jgi:hypothetical protein
MKLSSFAAIEVSSIVMKLSSWAVAGLTTVVVTAAELTAMVVVVAELSAVVVAVTQVAVVAVMMIHEYTVDIVVLAAQVTTVVAVTKLTAVVVVVLSPSWKIQSLPRQTQCPACTIGCDNQHSLQVYIHHSLKGIPTCFYGG